MSAQRALTRYGLQFSALALIACTMSPPFLSAQSLGDVARREQARRQATPAGKVYTNGDLPVVEPAVPMPPAPAQQAAAPAPAGGAPQADAAAPGQAPVGQAAAGAAPDADEQHWRTRVAVEREALARAEAFAEALQSRINALSTDFVNRDDPAQRTVIAADRQKALTELERVRKEMADHTKAISAIQDEARRAGVPAGWVR